MLIDTHCHLSDEKFSDVKDTLKKALAEGVEKIIMPSTSLDDAKRVAILAVQEKQYCLVGIHPENVERIGDVEREIKTLEEIIRTTDRVVGIGEIGLDYYWDKEKKTEARQVEVFRKQMKLALETDLPVAIHMRGAEEEMKSELQNLKELPNGQFHCFAGSEKFLKRVLGLGFYVSFCGNITYKSAGNLRELLKMVPLDRLLLETDSPYLPPEPVRGTVNTPANVKIIAEFVARELNLELTELAKITSQNAKCLYSLDT